MSQNLCPVSVIIPTHNRSASLRRTLDALCLQTYPHENFEVLVVADGCIDDTVEMARAYKAPYTLHVLEQEGKGAAAARNSGAAHASGKLFLFLDDDVVPTPSLMEAHVLAHEDQMERVVIGPYPPVLQGVTEFVHIQKRLWWGSKFHALLQAHHRYTYRDMLSGNFSIKAELFEGIGGFDATIRDCGGEDYEFGVRLIKAGASVTSTPAALAYHYEHETTDLDRLLKRARQEGYADVQIGRRHPELRLSLELASFEELTPLVNRTFRKLALDRPTIGDYVARRLYGFLGLFERLRLRGFWLRLYALLFRYWYWRGVGEELGGQRALAGFLQGGYAYLDYIDDEIELDLRKGLEEAVRRLDEKRPASARILYGEHTVGWISPQPGAEPLRGPHLPFALATRFARPLTKAIAMERVFSGINQEDLLL